MKNEPTVIKEFPGQAVEAHRLETGKLPGEIGKCDTCGNERALEYGICALCAQRAAAAAAPQEERRDGHSKLVTEDGELKTVDPHPESNGPQIIAQMSITLFADGNCSVTGPLKRRDQIVQMALGALDISYEISKAVQEEARIAATPPPKKWSKAWFAHQFARKRVATQLLAAAEAKDKTAASG